jgi:hypothetical protein
VTPDSRFHQEIDTPVQAPHCALTHRVIVIVMNGLREDDGWGQPKLD